MRTRSIRFKFRRLGKTQILFLFSTISITLLITGSLLEYDRTSSNETGELLKSIIKTLFGLDTGYVVDIGKRLMQSAFPFNYPLRKCNLYLYAANKMAHLCIRDVHIDGIGLYSDKSPNKGL